MSTFNEPGHYYAPPPGASPQPVPVAEGVAMQMPSTWSTGLLGCSSPGDCLFALCVPCITYGQVAEYLRPQEACCAGDFGAACLTMLCCPWISCCLLEQFSGAVRQRFAIRGGCFSDCAMACICPCCLLLRMKREMVSRGALTRREEVAQQQRIITDEQRQLTPPVAHNAMPNPSKGC